MSQNSRNTQPAEFVEPTDEQREELIDAVQKAWQRVGDELLSEAEEQGYKVGVGELREVAADYVMHPLWHKISWQDRLAALSAVIK